MAVIQTGGKQYLVQNGDVLKVEKLEGEAGGKLTFDKVLMTTDGDKVQVGTPHISTKVGGEILEQGRKKKLTIQKFKPKVRYHKKLGHRQAYTKVKIDF